MSIHLIIWINISFQKWQLFSNRFIFQKKTISPQIKAHEVYIKPLKPRESILDIKESDDEDDYESDKEVKLFEDEDED